MNIHGCPAIPSFKTLRLDIGCLPPITKDYQVAIINIYKLGTQVQVWAFSISAVMIKPGSRDGGSL